jgi:hypothetical protein
VSDQITIPQCSICRHAQRTLIEEAIGQGEPVRRIARRFFVARSALQRHRQRHMAEPPSEPVGAEGGTRVPGLLPHCEERTKTIEPDPIAAGPSGEDRILTAPWRGMIAGKYCEFTEGHRIAASDWWLVRECHRAGVPMAVAPAMTAAEMAQQEHRRRMSDFHAPGPPAPKPPLPEPAPVPATIEEAERIVRADPGTVGRAMKAAEDLRRVAAERGAPGRQIEFAWLGWRRRFAEAEGAAEMLIIARSAALGFRQMAAEAHILGLQEHDRSGGGGAAVVRGFDPRPWLRSLAARGAALALSASGDITAPRGALNETDRQLLREHRAEIAAALADREIV